MNGKRTTKKVRKDGVQEGLARVQEDQAQGHEEEAEELTEEEADTLLEALYEVFVQGQPWGA